MSGIVSSCGCNSFVGGPSSNENVTVDKNGILTNPTQATFYFHNDPFDFGQYSFSSTTSQVLKQGAGKLLTTVPVALLTGSGAYTLSLQLDYINTIVGAIFDIQLNFPASTHPTVLFFDRQSGNQLAYTISSPGVVSFTTVVRFVWTGSIWAFVVQV